MYPWMSTLSTFSCYGRTEINVYFQDRVSIRFIWKKVLLIERVWKGELDMHLTDARFTCPLPQPTSDPTGAFPSPISRLLDLKRDKSFGSTKVHHSFTPRLSTAIQYSRPRRWRLEFLNDNKLSTASWNKRGSKVSGASFHLIESRRPTRSRDLVAFSIA